MLYMDRTADAPSSRRRAAVPAPMVEVHEVRPEVQNLGAPVRRRRGDARDGPSGAPPRGAAVTRRRGGGMDVLLARAHSDGLQVARDAHDADEAQEQPEEALDHRARRGPRSLRVASRRVSGVASASARRKAARCAAPPSGQGRAAPDERGSAPDERGSGRPRLPGRRRLQQGGRAAVPPATLPRRPATPSRTPRARSAGTPPP